ncbi:PTS ascorbate transporter subunit IIC, partial [Clostridium perfringens]|nr:PTS ascorbate transporter subunit IIC [Clostridium perfringens]
YYFQLAQFGGWHGNFDFATVWPVIGILMNKLQYVGVGIAIIALLAIPQLQYMKNKKGYFKLAENYDEYIAEKAAGEI